MEEDRPMSESDQHQNADPGRAELPLPDYDHLPLGSLTHRVRTLDAEGVTTLLDYEQEHGRRQPVITMLEERLMALQQGAQPSGGSPEAAQPEAAEAPSGKTHASPQTEGPPINPPSQGDPTNPAQPR
jgi:hypothetical protein